MALRARGIAALRRVRQFTALGAGERLLLCEAALLVPLVRLALWVLPSRTIVRMVQRLSTRASRRRGARVGARSVAWAVDAVSRRVPGATCLTQAVAAQLLLLLHGHAAELCLGVTRGTDGSFRAHAWLEHEGRILVGGSGSAAYTRLPVLPRAGRLFTH